VFPPIAPGFSFEVVESVHQRAMLPVLVINTVGAFIVLAGLYLRETA
jgi:hypothetical protein